ncbi:phosphate acyltransferase PlsX [bacterium]|nr:MAG: phosphate acyltransferase PlsX [bacterium]
MIAIDAMGGDNAPQVVIAGALNAAKDKVPVALFGPHALIKSQLDQLDSTWPSYPITVIDAPEEIGMAENPVLAVRKKTHSSLVQAVQSVKNKQCTGVISAGNSGAFMVAASLILGRSENVERPAILGLLPGLYGHVVGLDLGANTECRPQHLYQFAHVGADYAQQVLGIANPRVGLLANGEEDEKGSVLTKETFSMLKQSDLNFVGNVEPYQIVKNKTDVVVCDGFSGNVLMKTMESVHQLLATYGKSELAKLKNEPGKQDIVSWGEHFLHDIENKFTSKVFGGAVLAGVNGRVIVCHGAANAYDITQAIKQAAARPVERK